MSTGDEFTFFCVDRTKNAPYAKLPLREDIAACPGFIGKGATLASVMQSIAISYSN